MLCFVVSSHLSLQPKKLIEGALDFDDAASETASVTSAVNNEESQEPMSLADRLASKGKTNSVAGTLLHAPARNYSVWSLSPYGYVNHIDTNYNSEVFYYQKSSYWFNTLNAPVMCNCKATLVDQNQCQVPKQITLDSCIARLALRGSWYQNQIPVLIKISRLVQRFLIFR